MIVDEERKYSLTKFCTKKGEKSVKVSDHNLLALELNIKWNSNDEAGPREEIFDYKNEESFQKFEMLTESNADLKQSFDNCSDLNQAANKWLKILNNLIHKSFRKIRIKKQKLSANLEALFTEKESLRSRITELENRENICDYLN